MQGSGNRFAKSAYERTAMYIGIGTLILIILIILLVA